MGERWLDIISRISPQEPVDLDAALAPLDPRTKGGHRSLFPPGAARPAVETGLAAEDAVCFGARITDATGDPTDLAMKLAQLAAEKNAEAIILSHVEETGLQRFGFRVERVVGDTEEDRAACEAQLCRFWNIVMVI